MGIDTSNHFGQNELPQFQDDYIISWDFSNKDFPCVTVSVIHKEKGNGARVNCTLLGASHSETGVISLQQALNVYWEREREKEKRAAQMKEQIAKCGEALGKATGAYKEMTATIKEAAKNE